MKKVSFGLAVAVVAASASAFTNLKSNQIVPVAAIVAFDIATQEYIFSLTDAATSCPAHTLALPCGITPLTYELPTTTDKLPASLVNNPAQTQVTSTTDTY